MSRISRTKNWWSKQSAAKQWGLILFGLALAGFGGYQITKSLKRSNPRTVTPSVAPGSQYSRSLDVKGGKYQFKGGFRVNLTRESKKAPDSKPEENK